MSDVRRVSSKEARAILGCSQSSLHAYRRAGLISGKKRGSNGWWVWDAASLEAMLKDAPGALAPAGNAARGEAAAQRALAELGRIAGY